jgi:hypothetical protein
LILADVDIDKNLARRACQLNQMPEKEFAVGTQCR